MELGVGEYGFLPAVAEHSLVPARPRAVSNEL